MVSLTSPKTFLVYEFILEHPKFRQYRVHKALGVAFALVNRVTQWMIERGWVEKRGTYYELVDAAGAVQALAVFRSMKSIQWFGFSTSLPQQEARKKIPGGAVYCLDSALSELSGYYKSNRVCVYVSRQQAEKLRKSLALNPGNKTVVEAYEPKPAVKKGRFTSPVRTVLDLACDGKTGLAQDLFQSIWHRNFAAESMKSFSEEKERKP